jgi:hypothetical protein
LEKIFRFGIQSAQQRVQGNSQNSNNALITSPFTVEYLPGRFTREILDPCADVVSKATYLNCEENLISGNFTCGIYEGGSFAFCATIKLDEANCTVHQVYGDV